MSTHQAYAGRHPPTNAHGRARARARRAFTQLLPSTVLLARARLSASLRDGCRWPLGDTDLTYYSNRPDNAVPCHGVSLAKKHGDQVAVVLGLV
ncbi:hypothetical protein SORBI_3001G192750 [Sorghum bicolor]|uniref:Uncharacterized protein n=1 Tax=Sorghum bicolor TaxID=4558 RepID=A0A1Z5S6G6_SORBI|nr:hypothetical protein SORBI_3001G192750 [Sorghum bicolor]